MKENKVATHPRSKIAIIKWVDDERSIRAGGERNDFLYWHEFEQLNARAWIFLCLEC